MYSYFYGLRFFSFIRSPYPLRASRYPLGCAEPFFGRGFLLVQLIAWNMEERGVARLLGLDVWEMEDTAYIWPLHFFFPFLRVIFLFYIGRRV